MTNKPSIFKPIPVPSAVDFNSTPTEVLSFAKDKGHLNIDCEFIREFITKTPNNPDDEDVATSCILGDLEVFCDRAEALQEQSEVENGV